MVAWLRFLQLNLSSGLPNTDQSWKFEFYPEKWSILSDRVHCERVRGLLWVIVVPGRWGRKEEGGGWGSMVRWWLVVVGGGGRTMVGPPGPASTQCQSVLASSPPGYQYYSTHWSLFSSPLLSPHSAGKANKTTTWLHWTILGHQRPPEGF